MKQFLFPILFYLAMPAAISAAPATEMMNEVYLQLQLAIGDQNRVWPSLEIRPGASSVLAYNKRKNIIYVDEKALSICQSFAAQEKDAFAFLLAHEMTHFYQDHDWKESGFATSFLAAQKIYSSHVADEKEADLFGAFITHIAGYRSVSMMGEIFDKVYAAYQLSDRLADYPDLIERKATALEVCGKVKELIQLFNAANYLLALGEHTAAASTYTHVLKFVKNKELYNNLGTSLVAAAALQMEYGQPAFRYPLELDLDIPLRDGADADKQEVLNKAIEYLYKAVEMDQSHYATFINLACAYSLSNQYPEAHKIIQQLNTLNLNPKQAAELAILQGIIAAQQKNTAEAQSFFQYAVNNSNEAGIQELVAYNTQQLSNTSMLQAPVVPMVVDNEIIGGISLLYENEFPFKSFVLRDDFSYEEKSIANYVSPTAVLTHFHTSDKTIALLSTTHTSERTEKGIQIGNTIEQIKITYGIPLMKTVNHSKGYYLILPQQKLFFIMNHQDEIIEWGVYEYY